MTSQLDAHVGQILDTLDKHGLSENTLLVFTSDHGDFMGNHWLWSKGGSHYDQAVRVPFIVRWPGHVPAGRKSESLQSLVDLPATFMNAAGLEAHPEMEGVDQTACWENPDKPARKEVLIDHRVEEFLHVHTLITEEHRLSIHRYADGSPNERELYDLSDGLELENLAGKGLTVEDRLSECIEEIAPEQPSSWQVRTSGS